MVLHDPRTITLQWVQQHHDYLVSIMMIPQPRTSTPYRACRQSRQTAPSKHPETASAPEPQTACTSTLPSKRKNAPTPSQTTCHLAPAIYLAKSRPHRQQQPPQTAPAPQTACASARPSISKNVRPHHQQQLPASTPNCMPPGTLPSSYLGAKNTKHAQHRQPFIDFKRNTYKQK